MSAHDDSVSLRHMFDFAHEACDLISGRRREDLENDRLLQLALTRLVEITGEAASRVSDKTRASLSKIPWPQIIGMRNRLIHGYDVMDLDILWDTICDDLPPLVSELKLALESQY